MIDSFKAQNLLLIDKQRIDSVNYLCKAFGNGKSIESKFISDMIKLHTATDVF